MLNLILKKLNFQLLTASLQKAKLYLKNESDLQEQLLKLKVSRHLTENEYLNLRPFDSYPVTFYALPKIHKVSLIEKPNYFSADTENETIPMRAINSCISPPCYAILKHLATPIETTLQ